MNLNSSRRGFLGALAGVIAAPRKLFAAKPPSAESGAAPSGFGQTGNPYQELGVTTVINAEGTMTMLGGSLIRPEGFCFSETTRNLSKLLRRKTGARSGISIPGRT